MWMVPEMLPGGTPVIDEPGLNATSPLSTDGPVFVMVELATAANVTSDPSDGGEAASAETIADATNTTSQRMRSGLRDEVRRLSSKFPFCTARYAPSLLFASLPPISDEGNGPWTEN
jgi:hypothetical protein